MFPFYLIKNYILRKNNLYQLEGTSNELKISKILEILKNTFSNIFQKFTFVLNILNII